MTVGATRTVRDRTGTMARVLSLFFSVQIIIQAIAMLVGLVVVNWLTKDEYARYTLAVTVASGISLIANSGFTSAILSGGAKVRHDRGALSALIASALMLRRRLTRVIISIAAPALLFLLLRNGATVLEAFVITGLVIVSVSYTVTSAVFNELLALEYRRNAMQRIALIVSILRLVSTTALLALPAAIAALPVALNAAATWVTCRLQTKPVLEHIDPNVESNERDIATIRKSFRALLPSNTFLVFQGQFVIVTLGALGHSGTLAQIGALSRFSIGFSLISTTTAAILSPTLARSLPSRVLRRYAMICGLVLFVLLIALSLAWLLSSQLLLVLGSDYANLEQELRIIMVAGAVACVIDVMSSLNECRGWVRGAWLQIPIAIVSMVLMGIFLDLQVPMQAAIATLGLVLPGVFAQLIQLVLGLRSLQKSEPTA